MNIYDTHPELYETGILVVYVFLQIYIASVLMCSVFTIYEIFRHITSEDTRKEMIHTKLS